MFVFRQQLVLKSKKVVILGTQFALVTGQGASPDGRSPVEAKDSALWKNVVTWSCDCSRGA